MLGQELTKKQIEMRNAEKMAGELKRTQQREETKKERELQALEKARQ